MGVALEGLGHDLLELELDLERRLARRQPGAIADTKDMRVDRDGRLAKSDVEHDIGGLAADARKLLEQSALARHLAAIFVDQHPRKRQHILGLVAVKTDRA